LCNLYFSFLTHGWCNQASTIYCTIHWKVTCYYSIVDKPLHNKKVFFLKIFDLKFFFCYNFLFSQKKVAIFWRKCFGKNIHHPWTQSLGFGQFFVNFHIFLQTFCQLIVNLNANAMSNKWKRKEKKMLSRNAPMLGVIKGIIVLSTLDRVDKK
jgi:hypothetical protein